MTDFAAFDLSDVSSTLAPRLREPHVTGRLCLYTEMLTLPLQDAYSEAHATLRGIRKPELRRGEPSTRARAPVSPQRTASLRTINRKTCPPTRRDNAAHGAGSDAADDGKTACDIPDLGGVYWDGSGELD